MIGQLCVGARCERPLDRHRLCYSAEGFAALFRAVCHPAGIRSDFARAVFAAPAEVRASADRHRSPLVLRCIEDHLAGQRYPLELIYTDAAVMALPPLPASA